MFFSDKHSVDDMMKPGREAFEFWISFFPTAPLFGVEWRFGEMMGQGPFGAMPPSAWSVPGFGGTPAAKTTTRGQKASAPATVIPVPSPAPPPPPSMRDAVAAEPTEAAKTEPAPAAKKPAAKKPAAVAKKVAEAPKKTAAPKKAADGKPAGLLAARPGDADDLKLIKGIGPGLEKELNGLGVYRFAQISGFSKADLKWIDDNLTAFKGRCFRDDWIGQARALGG